MSCHPVTFLGLMIAVSVGSPGAIAGASAPTTQPSTTQSLQAPTTQSLKPVRQIDVTLWGSIRQIKGFEWPKVADGEPQMALSAWIEGPCDVTIHLPGGKTLKIGTRSILIVSRLRLRDDDRDTVVEIAAPVAGEYAPLVQKVKEANELIAEWGAIPNQHMKDVLASLAKARGGDQLVIVSSGPGSTRPTTEPALNPFLKSESPLPLAEISAAWAELDESSQCAIRFLQKPKRKYNIVANICVKESVWGPILDHTRGYNRAATHPAVSRPYVPIP